MRLCTVGVDKMLGVAGVALPCILWSRDLMLADNLERIFARELIAPPSPRVKLDRCCSGSCSKLDRDRCEETSGNGVPASSHSSGGVVDERLRRRKGRETGVLSTPDSLRL